MFSRRIARISVVAAVLGALCLHQTAASGQPADATDKVTQLNREALAAVDKREFEKARELLKRALDLCKSAGLEQHPAAARTHVHMGVIIIQGFKNPELGKKQFAKALQIDPTITITKSLSTPDLEEAFAEAKAGDRNLTVGGEAETAPPAPPPAPATGGDGATRTSAPVASGFSYHTVSEVKQGSSIVITVTVEESLKFHKLVLAYREQGTGEFLGREMEPVGDGAYRAEIPASATGGSSVAYYMEAQDESGNPVASRGTETRPLVIAFAATARPSSGHADATVERKAEARKKRAEDQGEDEGDAGKIFVSLLVGSGFGYVSGKGETNADVPVSGTASGALLGHVAPEVGYWWKPDVMLSLQGRFQLVTGTTELVKEGKSYGTVPAALAVFAKATWLTSTSGSLRPFLSGGIGGGQIRHVVTFGNLNDCGPSGGQTCKDSVAAGPVLAEVGGGLFYRLSDNVELVLSSNAQVAAPKFTINLDVNGGVGFVF
jgi:hypothetical protein